MKTLAIYEIDFKNNLEKICQNESAVKLKLIKC